MKEESKERNKEKQRVYFALCLILIGLLILSSNYFLARKHEVFERIAFEIDNEPQNIEDPNNTEETPPEEQTETPQDNKDNNKDTYVDQSYYIGRLEIPKINLKRGFADIKSKQNNINKNIAIMPTSKYPDIKKGNFIIAGHTGNAWNCFFSDLNKLKVGDIAYVYYKDKKYTYRLVSKYDQKKDGTARIFRDFNKTVMTLITCKKHTNDKQTIFIFNQE